MRRICVVSLLIVSVVALGLAPANAAKPQIDRSGVTVVDLHFPAGALCDFALDVHQVLKTKLITFVDANGDPTRAISTGRIHVWETNADTGRTLFLSISGPSFFDATGALVRGTGGWSGVQLEDGTWIHARGLLTFNANLLVTSVRGHVEPLCDSLA